MKALRITLGVLAATLLVLLALAGAVWIWGNSSTSLATAVVRLAGYLPAGQTLEVKDVQGSLRGGGRIGWLRWQKGELSVEARDVSVAWSLSPLLDGELRLDRLAVGHLRIDDRRAPSAPTPPTDLSLPLRVEVPFAVDTLEWAGPPALQITGLKGHYIFDSKEHKFDLDNVQISSGKYRVSGHLQAQAPMALSVQLQGAVATTLPSSRQTVTVQAHAEAHGALAGRDATLELQAQLVPELQAGLANAKPATQPVQPTQPMQASVSARIQPWQAQAVTNANARWQALNLAVLWPQAPQTRLSGEAAITPAGQGWRAGVKLINTLSGPWNQQRLPLENLNANVVFVAGQWTVESLQASGAGGRIEAQGKLSAAAPNAMPGATWQGHATVFGINPAALDSRLSATVLDGQLTAQQTPSGIAFDAQVQAATRKTATTQAATLDSLRLKTVHAQGLWQAPLLTLDTLAVQTDDAQLQGRLTFHTVSQAAEGRLALTLPGGNALLEGQIASTHGKGDIRLHIADAGLAARWLQRWPGIPTSLGRDSCQGVAELMGHWSGGWQRQGQELQIQAKLTAPRLDLLGADQSADQTWRLRDLQADLSGTLRALNLSASGQAQTGSRHFALQAQAHGGQVNDGIWQARVDAAQLIASNSLQPGDWTLQLSEGMSIDWKHSGLSRTLDISAGTARLSGPVPGVATMSWQAAHGSQSTTGSAGRTEWRTQGSLQGLPLAWLDLLGQTKMANLGLHGDLLFGGQWDAAGGDTLRLRATLERTGGDLQVQTNDVNAGPLSAGVRDAHLLITADGDRMAASLRWDSERAGQAQADFSTRLRHQGGTWIWPADAPLAGTMRAQLPPVGAWSLLAPPGWRLRGTLDADAVLSGTRGTPQWRGSLQAQDMAVRSVADGIDFSNGTLRATLDGQRMDILEFHLQGAGGSRGGGQLSVTGSVLWAPPAEPAATAVSRLRMDLDVQAQGLRVSARADRRLVVSGKLSARLADARLTIRGTLKADQALFILPDDTAPQLSDDVVVRAVGTNPVSTAPTTTPARATAGVGVGVRVTPDVAITLDLGPDFQLRGRGLVTRLAGSLELHNTPERALVPRLTGELRTVRGTYKAYGQLLDVEEGVLRFAGPFDNPALDILAIRPNLQQRVGVQISGTALAPVVRLYAEPDLPDAEKLAWLVLGRMPASGGTESAVLQQAALALLGGGGRGLPGGLAQALGLDELSMRGATTNADGSTTTGATVTLGKRVSRDFYVAYERSLAGTMGTFYIFYDLSRRFTLRAQTGEQSAVDLIFTLRYD